MPRSTLVTWLQSVMLCTYSETLYKLFSNGVTDRSNQVSIALMPCYDIKIMLKWEYKLAKDTVYIPRGLKCMGVLIG